MQINYMQRFFLFTVVVVLLTKSVKSQGLSPSDFLVNSTIKINCIDRKDVNGKAKYYKSSGTGFFFRFKTPKGEIPYIITNKHVINDAEKGTLYFKRIGSNGLPDYNNIEKVDFDKFKSLWILHPDTSVDLAILPILPLLQKYVKLGKPLSIAPYTEEYIPNDSIRNTICAIEDILMIGYPFGLQDVKNYLPIIRRGLTATPAYLNYNAVPEFLLDISDYSGSSGSPVIIYNPMTFTTRDGRYVMKPRLILLGINYATYTKDFEGKIVPKLAYNISDSLRVTTTMPYNIGIVIKSERILEFKTIL